MNPRIYKKQAKRAVELLRSHGGWPSMPEVYKVDRWSHPMGSGAEKNGFGIDGCPVFGQWGYTMDGREWDESCPLSDWIDCHYWSNCVPDGYFKTGDEPWPSITLQQRRTRLKCSQIATGWRWRGGKAVKISI